VLQIGPRHGSRGFGPEGERISTPVGKGVHLLFNDVRGLTDTSREKFGPLQDRDANLREAETLKDLSCGSFYKLPLPDLIGKDVIKTANCLISLNFLPFGTSINYLYSPQKLKWLIIGKI